MAEHGTEEAKVGETRPSPQQVGARLKDRAELGERIEEDFFDVIPGIGCHAIAPGKELALAVGNEISLEKFW